MEIRLSSRSCSSLILLRSLRSRSCPGYHFLSHLRFQRPRHSDCHQRALLKRVTRGLSKSATPARRGCRTPRYTSYRRSSVRFCRRAWCADGSPVPARKHQRYQGVTNHSAGTNWSTGEDIYTFIIYVF